MLPVMDIMAGRGGWPYGLLRSVLKALSKVYGAVVARRNEAFDSKKKAVYHSAIPCISIGNITAGGTGKTPMVAYVCQYVASLGENAVVLTRGYKAKNNEESRIVAQKGNLLLPIEESGDEAALLGELLPEASVVLGRHRNESAELAVRELHPTVFVLDDGFQHRQMGRTIDVVLLDATNPFGFGELIPRGLLREPLENLRRGDFFIFTKSNLVSEEALQAAIDELHGYVPGAPVALAVHGPKPAYVLKPAAGAQQTASDADKQTAEATAARASAERETVDIAGLKVLAVTAIGNPQSFVKTLEGCGAEVVDLMAYGDHHAYSAGDLRDVDMKAKSLGVDAVIMTEKDGVKWRALEGELSKPCLVLPIGITFTAGEEGFHQCIEGGLAQRKV